MSLLRRHGFLKYAKPIEILNEYGIELGTAGSIVFQDTPVQDDILVVGITVKGPNSHTLSALSGSGWTILTAVSARVYLAYRKFNTSDTLTYTMTWSGSRADGVICWSWNLRNCNTISPLNDYSSGTNGGSGGTWSNSPSSISHTIRQGCAVFVLSCGATFPCTFTSSTSGWLGYSGIIWDFDVVWKVIAESADINFSSTYSVGQPNDGGTFIFRPNQM